MKYSTARPGRALVIRLEDGDVVHECIEEAARAEGIARAAVILLGGADGGSRMVVGPEDARAHPIVPMERALHDVHEMVGAGTLFPDEVRPAGAAPARGVRPRRRGDRRLHPRRRRHVGRR